MSIVLAFAGKIGSGKTTVTKALAAVLRCQRVSFGDYVRDVVSQRGLAQTRETLQLVGTELLERDLRGFCREVLVSCGWKSGEMLMIDGLRHAETIEPIRQIVKPADLKIVFLALDDQIRRERLVLRDNGDEAAITRAEDHSSERQVGFLAERADLVIQGSQPVSEIVGQITKWIKCQ
jgi:dephospho-CoA kinase